MSNSDHSKTTEPVPAVDAGLSPPMLANGVTESPATRTPIAARRESRRWWIKLFLQPLLLLAGGLGLLASLGIAQHYGWLTDGSALSGRPDSHADRDGHTMYICPMMCTPPQSEPGRCPVCGMELVPTSGSQQRDPHAVHIDSAARRVANIQTAPVQAAPLTRTIQTIGELRYDESALKSISAYVDGRLDRLYADYTGIEVSRGDPLALLYSPQLYASQAELLLAKRARDNSQNSSSIRISAANDDMYRSAKERLVLLGMTEAQIEQIEEAGTANSRMLLTAPIGGTVIEKLAVEGQYVTEGDAIYRLADLSTLWLMLRLFPEDATAMRYGQRVEAEVQSLPGESFSGRVAFIDPNVDPQTRTVGVRVVIPNPDGRLRVGDYAKASVEVPLSGASQRLVYDPELANKWISPKHPEIIADRPGQCPKCGADLVPADQLGFTDQVEAQSEALWVPRDAVLMAGNNSVLYVETEPGRFELRRVVLGPSIGDRLVIRSGVELGETVATRGNFLIDSQMQLAGNPSLIDPSRLESRTEDARPDKWGEALAELAPADRQLATLQAICPVTDQPLGSMGTPKKVDVNGAPVFICCEACRSPLLQEPKKYTEKLKSVPASGDRNQTPDGIPQMDLPPIEAPQMIEMLESEPDAQPPGNGSPADAASSQIAERLSGYAT